MTNLTTDTTAPALPQAPAGHFWRIHNRVWVEDREIGPYQIASDEAITVELRRALKPTRFRKRERSTLVASETVELYTQENGVYTIAELAARAANNLAGERVEKSIRLDRIKQVVGDYR